MWLAEEAGRGLPARPTVVGVSPLLRADPRPAAAGAALVAQRGAGGLCEALYAEPAAGRGPEDWARPLAPSGRTLARRFEAELGMRLWPWLRLLKAIEPLVA